MVVKLPAPPPLVSTTHQETQPVDDTQSCRLTGAVGSWFRSKQEMPLKAGRLVWWSNFQAPCFHDKPTNKQPIDTRPCRLTHRRRGHLVDVQTGHDVKARLVWCSNFQPPPPPVSTTHQETQPVDDTQSCRLTGAAGSWFRSRQLMTLKARLVWWYL